MRLNGSLKQAEKLIRNRRVVRKVTDSAIFTTNNTLITLSATIQIGGTIFSLFGTGRARRNKKDSNNPRIGASIALNRARLILAAQLIELADGQRCRVEELKDMGIYAIVVRP